jgi:hypothetical protein
MGITTYPYGDTTLYVPIEGERRWLHLPVGIGSLLSYRGRDGRQLLYTHIPVG